MSDFMKHEILFGRWLLVDGSCGIEAIPAELIGDTGLNVGDTLEIGLYYEDVGYPTLLLRLRDYIESRLDEVSEIRLVEGYGARLSAPGYMDQTDWVVFETIAEATDYLEETYGDE